MRVFVSLYMLCYSDSNTRMNAQSNNKAYKTLQSFQGIIVVVSILVLTVVATLVVTNKVNDNAAKKAQSTVVVKQVPTKKSIPTPTSAVAGVSTSSVPTVTPTSTAIPTLTPSLSPQPSKNPANISYEAFKGIAPNYQVSGLVKISYEANRLQTREVRFFIDSSHTPVNTDTQYPYALGIDGVYDTRKLLSGTHVLQVEIVKVDGTKVNDRINFISYN
jgi:hypothetical protein